ncbi:C-C chemokine receptor type 6 [Trichomycterus rosablanca]|uniref:C-C chemokine receptor type 6 n=1 Tax=Trichomycterus rosablanca TaxID=2290929 RepID=UPI002F35195F
MSQSTLYAQKYRKEWESKPEFKGWLKLFVGDDTWAYCLSDTEKVDYFYEDDNSSEVCELKSNYAQSVTNQIYSVICALGLLGNVLVIITYACYKKARTITDILLVNVALSDLLFVLALPLIIYNEQYNWSMGTWACKLLRGVYSINLYSSTLLLACISGDRYVAIVKARRSFVLRLKAKIYSRLICLTIWLLAIALSMPTFIFSSLSKEPLFTDFNDVHDFNVNECTLQFMTNRTAKLMKILVPSTQVSVGFFLPLLVMAVCYTSVMVTLLRAQNYQKHKAVRVVLAVVVVFILCHLPYNTTLLIHTTRLFNLRDCKTEQNILLALSVTKSMAYLHCCLNPILYAFIGVKFRNHFYQIMEDLWCLGKRYFSPRRSSQQTTEMYIPAQKSMAEPCHDKNSSFTM